MPASFTRWAESRRRTWEAALVRDLKRFGWQWQRCRVRQPARVKRRLLVLARATRWMLVLGQRARRRGWPPTDISRSPFACSLNTPLR